MKGALGIACVIALGCGDDTTMPSIDAPRSPDAARADGPAIDAPAIDAPAIDAPMIDAPAIDGPMPDAACVPSGAENCFNGIDDDCNGLTDCEDPACTAIAECVPSAGGLFALGVHVPMGTACPAGYTAGGPVLAQGLQSSGACSGCTCDGFTVCGATVRELSATACPGTEIANRIVWSNQCTSLPFTTNNVHVDALQLQSTCSSAGTPMVPPTSWTTQVQFCRATDMGAGCSAGSICLRKATQHCELRDSVTACSGNYTPESGGTWYTSVTDNRTCGASCQCGSTGGSCGTSFVRAFTANSICSGAFEDLVSNADNCGLAAPPQSGRIILQGDTPPTCTPANQLSGTATPSGPQTLCCL